MMRTGPTEAVDQRPAEDPQRIERHRKGFTQGTHRLIAPEETLARVEKLLPVLGITRIANVTGLDKIGIPVVMVCRPNSRSVSVSQGKGVSLAAAKASGVMESIESFHAERVAHPLRLGSHEDLRYGEAMIDVAGLPRPADSLYTPFARLLWIAGRDLFTDRPLWLPYEMVHLDFTLPLPSGHGCFAANSNGLASGNHILEAVSHAICELIERDATTLWHCGGEAAEARTRIDLDTVDDPPCRALLDRFAAAGVLAAAWETTSDIGVPAFLCRILEDVPPPRSTYRPASGMGCHPAREVALARALTEAAQSRLTFISGARDDMSRGEYAEYLRPETYALWRARMAGSGGRDFAAGPGRYATSLEDDVAWLLARLRTVGMAQAAVVDLTRPEFGVPVARVVIPGLEGVDGSPRYRPGARARRVTAAKDGPAA